MTIKLGATTYAHGFCLLVHGLWSLKCRGNASDSGRLSISHGEADSGLGSKCNSFLPEIEFFYNP